MNSPPTTSDTPVPLSRAPSGWSMRNRLILLSTLTAGLAWALAAAHYESTRLYEGQLRDVSSLVLAFAGHHIEEVRAMGQTDQIFVDTDDSLPQRFSYRIWSSDGTLLMRTQNALRESEALPLAEGMSHLDLDGRPLHLFVLRSADGGHVIQVVEDMTMREQFLPSLNLWLFAFFAVSTGLLVLFIRWSSGRAMRSIDQTARQLTDRSPTDLRRVSSDDPPRELEPVLDSVNTLLERIEKTMSSERGFTSAAAHELRTPLAAIRMQAQVAERARSQQEAQACLRTLQACVDRASHTIDQLLMLARVDAMSLQAHTIGPVRIDEVVRTVVKDLGPLIEAHGTRVDLELQEGSIHAIEFALFALVRNLVDNAIRHSPASGRVLVRTFGDAARVVLTVEDSGLGIAEEDRERVFDRFYRLPESGADGCGVGLSIVRSVADAHQANVQLDASPLGGLKVTVDFPPS
jgi:signal transduction histidine kinase